MALTLLAFAFAMVVGIVVAAFRVGPVPPLRLAGATWVEVVRNVPLAVIFTFFFFGLTKVDVQFHKFVTAVLVLGIYTSAFVAETVRAGINSVARGQAEAARAIGLTFPQTLWTVILPQALRTVVAPLGSVFIALTKNSSLASLISVEELTFVAEDLGNNLAQPVAAFAGAAIAYLVLTVPSGLAVGALERRVAIKR